MKHDEFYRAMRKIGLSISAILTVTLFAASLRLIKFMFEV